MKRAGERQRERVRDTERERETKREGERYGERESEEVRRWQSEDRTDALCRRIEELRSSNVRLKERKKYVSALEKSSCSARSGRQTKLQQLPTLKRSVVDGASETTIARYTASNTQQRPMSMVVLFSANDII